MELIPVLDLVAGEVVVAIAGSRRRYRPLAGEVGSDPVAVLDWLLHHYRASTVYVADLDAITDSGSNAATIMKLAGTFPDVECWVDQGLRKPIRGTTPVAGTESLRGPGQLLACRPSVLSLDYRHNRPLGNAAITRHVEAWPRRVIMMELDRVGMASGPNLERLRQHLRLAPATRFFAAGGIRNDRDISRLHALGCAGVLVSRALHGRKLAFRARRGSQTTP